MFASACAPITEPNKIVKPGRAFPALSALQSSSITIAEANNFSEELAFDQAAPIIIGESIQAPIFSRSVVKVSIVSGSDSIGSKPRESSTTAAAITAGSPVSCLLLAAAMTATRPVYASPGSSHMVAAAFANAVNAWLVRRKASARSPYWVRRSGFSPTSVSHRVTSVPNAWMKPGEPSVASMSSRAAAKASWEVVCFSHSPISGSLISFRFVSSPAPVSAPARFAWLRPTKAFSGSSPIFAPIRFASLLADANVS